MSSRFHHSIVAVVVLAALPAAWTPLHLGCEHRRAAATEHASPETAAHQGHDAAPAPADGHCGKMIPLPPGDRGVQLDQAECCDSHGFVALCCTDRESIPVVISRTADTPRAQEAAPAPVQVIPDTDLPLPPGLAVAGCGDPPPPARHRYRDLSVLLL